MERNTYSVDESLERKFDFKKLKRAFVYVKPRKKMMIVTLVLSSIASLVSLLPPFLLSKALDVAIPNKDIGLLWMLGLFVLGAILITAVLSAIRGVIMAKVGQQIIYDLRMDVFRHLQKLSFSYYDSRPHGKILVRVVNYVNSVSNTLSNGIINAIISLVNIIDIAFYMFILDVKLALIICIGIPPLLAIIVLLKNRQKKSLFEFNNKNSNLTAFSCEHIEGVKVTQIFNRQDENLKIYEKLNAIYRKFWYRMCIYTNLLSPITENLKQIVVGLVYIFGILIIKPSVEIGVLIGMASYASLFWQPIIRIANIYNNFLTAISYLERIFQTIDEPVEIQDSPKAKPLNDIRGNVEFKNVNFSYEKGIRVLNDVSFSVEKGKSVALVGATGSGKSTIVSLISRFYDVDSGDVLIDGVSVGNITLHSLRSQMGIMLQDSFIFTGTVEDNIRYGKLDATRDEIIAAAKAVCADDFVSKLDKGYDTKLSEKGGQLSQGEKQLIALARTMLSNPAILVLDEATSSIDAKTEHYLQEGINRLLRGRTSFIVAHRLSTIKNCDQIMFIKDGEIVERGSHDELMQKKGYYYELSTSQTVNA